LSRNQFPLKLWRGIPKFPLSPEYLIRILGGSYFLKYIFKKYVLKYFLKKLFKNIKKINLKFKKSSI
jgi:hypothetical protein